MGNEDRRSHRSTCGINNEEAIHAMSHQIYNSMVQDADLGKHQLMHPYVDWDIVLLFGCTTSNAGLLMHCFLPKDFFVVQVV